MAKGPIVTRDKFILCTFPIMFRGRPYVLEQSDSLSDVFSKVPEYSESEDETLCICEVIGSRWRLSPSDPSDANPIRVETLFEIQKFSEPSEDSDEDEGTLQRRYLRDNEEKIDGI